MSASTTKLVDPPEDLDHLDDELRIAVRSADDIEAAKHYVRELCSLLGLRGYVAQTVVGASEALGRKLLELDGQGSLCLRVDDAQGWIVVVAELADAELADHAELARGLEHARKHAAVLVLEPGRVELCFSYVG